LSCKKGEDGKDGVNGQPGTANVQYSEWFTPATYQKDTVYSVWGFSYTKTVSGITQPILDSGTVLVYPKFLGYNQPVLKPGEVGQLPINLTYNQGGVTTDTWSARATVGNLKIRFVNDRNIYTSISNSHQFRYIIIPGGVRTTGRGNSNYSYKDICRMYNV